MHILVGLLPVFLFLLALIALDSYKLIRIQAIVVAIVMGCFAAFLAFVANSIVLNNFGVSTETLVRYAAPLIEELLKVSYLIFLFKKKRIGFMVDAAIYGFAIGAGFAFAENIYYLQAIHESNLFLWIIRGLGTAVMHGGTTAIVGIAAKSLADRRDSDSIATLIPGVVFAVVGHSFYNHFFLPPVLSTAVLLVTLPILVVITFQYSERSTREWLGVGFDSDVEMLEMINNGTFSQSRVGQYLSSLQDRFSGGIVADMLCLIRIHNELSIKAKGMLLMREAGFDVPPSEDVKAMFTEMKYLEKNIGPTGQMAILPVLRTSMRDLWQMHMLGAK